jgi:hypothetical protein
MPAGTSANSSEAPGVSEIILTPIATRSRPVTLASGPHLLAKGTVNEVLGSILVHSLDPKNWYMKVKTLLLLLCLVTVEGLGQSSAPKYQPGTITAVSPHQLAPGEQPGDVAKYDLSIKVGDTNYVVLYTPPNGAKTVEYAAGLDFLFLVSSDTLTINRGPTGAVEMPILRREGAPAESGLDWSKAPSQYYSLKLENLTKVLNLSDDQQAKVKPILENEAGELRTMWNNTVLSKKDKLNTLEKLVRSSDKKMKPFLTDDQTRILADLRKSQKQELKKRIEEQTASRQN